MVAGGLFCIDPATGIRKLGGYDPSHARNVVGFAQAALEACSNLQTPLGTPVEIRWERTKQRTQTHLSTNNGVQQSAMCPVVICTDL